MGKIIREVLVLLWKAIRLVLWARLKAILQRFALAVLLAAAVLAVIAVAARSCGGALGAAERPAPAARLI